jgi:hypothetical protein
MAHFAKVENGVVTQVIVIEQDVLNTGHWGDPASWIQTSYNTVGGVHTQGGNPLRKNFAGVGFTYDSQRDAFIPPKPYASWVLDEGTCNWGAPTPMPVEEGKTFVWNEDTTSWIEFVVPVVEAVVETPAVETPVVEETVVETPVVETVAETVVEPAVETPVTETPTTPAV